MGSACSDESGPVAQVGYEYDRFLLEGVSLIDGLDGKGGVSISADRVVDQKRRTADGFITYQNLKEIDATGVRIEVALGDGDQVPTLLHQSLMMLGTLSQPAPPEDFDATQLDTDAEVLTRIRFSDLFITVRLPDQRMLSIETAAARLNLMPHAFVFRDPLTLRMDDGRQVEASKAVWSEDHGGIYFPEGYELSGASGSRAGVLTISSRGFFLSETPVQLPTIKMADLIEGRESVLLALFLNRIPKGLLPVIRMFYPQWSDEGNIVDASAARR